MMANFVLRSQPEHFHFQRQICALWAGDQDVFKQSLTPSSIMWCPKTERRENLVIRVLKVHLQKTRPTTKKLWKKAEKTVVLVAAGDRGVSSAMPWPSCFIPAESFSGKWWFSLRLQSKIMDLLPHIYVYVYIYIIPKPHSTYSFLTESR